MKKEIHSSEINSFPNKKLEILQNSLNTPLLTAMPFELRKLYIVKDIDHAILHRFKCIEVFLLFWL